MSTEHDTISIEDMIPLRMAYFAAKDAGLDTFQFHGKEVYVPYARYMIEYLDSVLDVASVATRVMAKAANIIMDEYPEDDPRYKVGQELKAFNDAYWRAL